MTMFNKATLMMALVQLVVESNVREEMTPRDWVKALLILEARGCLYYGFDGDKVSKMAIAYRVEEIDDKVNNLIPENESGSILWVAVFISRMKDRSGIKTEILDFFKKYKDIDTIAYATKEEKIIKIPRRIISDGQKRKDRRRPNTNVSGRPPVLAGN